MAITAIGNVAVDTVLSGGSGATRKSPIAGLEETYASATAHAAERAIMTGGNGIMAERMAVLRPKECPVITHSVV